MSTIGQIIYNLEDYNSSGGYISTSSSNHGNVISSESSNYETDRINIYEDLVKAFGSTGFYKIGIQAPPGTKVLLNSNKTILIGRTGVYELDEGITITNLKFIQSKLYELDEEATQIAIQSGSSQIDQAEKERKQSLTELDSQYPNDKNEEYWRRYGEIQKIYKIAYDKGLTLFNQGLNGIYKLPNPENPEAPENFQDLINVIIDFIY